VVVTSSRENGRLVFKKKDGFALPIALALGMVMIAFAGTSILVAQNARNNAVQRRTSGASLLVSDSAVARAMLQLSNPNNGMLLVRNYDPINPATGTNYLGADSVFKSGDETATPVDEWTGYNPSGSSCFQQMGWSAPNIALTGTITPNETYTIRAYRYNKQKQLGTLLVEGNFQGQASLVSVTFSIEPILDNFPGVLLENRGWTTLGTLALRGRQVLGSKGNIYYGPNSSADSSLTGSAKPGDATRPSYFNAIYSSNTNDGANGDTVTGKIFACRLQTNIPAGTTGTNLGLTGTNLGLINTSQTIQGVGGTSTTPYQVDKIDLANSDTLTVDTTGGSVRIDVTDKGNPGWTPEQAITLRNNAKILNIRTDGQPPKVGDLRIMLRGNSQVNLYDKTCIQNAFVYIPQDELRLLTSGSGCPGGQNTNFEGVVWAEQILSSKNSASNRLVTIYAGAANTEFESLVTPGATSGIAVPDDVSSLTDVLDYVNWPVRYRYGSIQNWQRVN
jgi:hypothetical protein